MSNLRKVEDVKLIHAQVSTAVCKANGKFQYQFERIVTSDMNKKIKAVGKFMGGIVRWKDYSLEFKGQPQDLLDRVVNDYFVVYTQHQFTTFYGARKNMSNRTA